MEPGSAITIAISSLRLYTKEEASYHRKLEQQEERIKRLTAEPVADDDDGNREYFIKQEKQAAEETKKMIPFLKESIDETLAILEELLVEEGQKGEASNVEEMNAAKDALAKAKTAIRETS